MIFMRSFSWATEPWTQHEPQYLRDRRREKKPAKSARGDPERERERERERRGGGAHCGRCWVTSAVTKFVPSTFLQSK